MLSMYELFMRTQVNVSGMLAELLVLGTTITLWIALAWLVFGGILIFLAFGIKCAFPFLHNWLQDAYPNGTVTGTVFLSAFTMPTFSMRDILSLMMYIICFMMIILFLYNTLIWSYAVRN